MTLICLTCCWYDEDWPFKCHNEHITCNWRMEEGDEAGTCTACVGWVGMDEINDTEFFG